MPASPPQPVVTSSSNPTRRERERDEERRRNNAQGGGGGGEGRGLEGWGGDESCVPPSSTLALTDRWAPERGGRRIWIVRWRCAPVTWRRVSNRKGKGGMGVRTGQGLLLRFLAMTWSLISHIYHLSVRIT